MKSFIDIERTLSSQPARLGARIARIDTGRGREELYADQLPELLRALAQQSRIESITASSAIEDVIVEAARAEKIAEEGEAAKPRTRNEEEFAGYRDAIDEIFRAERQEPMSVPLILRIHRRLYQHTEISGGRFKQDENYIGNRNPDGSITQIFDTVPKRLTEFYVAELVERYNAAVKDGAGHPLLLIGAFILDFLAIHPVGDGNGRVSRILTTQMLLHQGYSVPRYVSIEGRIFETKNSYYDALEASQRDWHEGGHDIWPWITYLVETLAESYDIFEQRISARRGLETMSKQEQVRAYVLEHGAPEFHIRQLKRALPGISEPTIRVVLNKLKREGKIRPSGRGPQAVWNRADTP
jgi:Fic family protein